jgi:hypothetical protein
MCLCCGINLLGRVKIGLRRTFLHVRKEIDLKVGMHKISKQINKKTELK